MSKFRDQIWDTESLDDASKKASENISPLLDLFEIRHESKECNEDTPEPQQKNT